MSIGLVSHRSYITDCCIPSCGLIGLKDGDEHPTYAWAEYDALCHLSVEICIMVGPVTRTAGKLTLSVKRTGY